MCEERQTHSDRILPGLTNPIRSTMRETATSLFVFEAPIDLLSFLCLFKKDWQKQSYLALGGVGEKALAFSF